MVSALVALPPPERVDRLDGVDAWHAAGFAHVDAKDRLKFAWETAVRVKVYGESVEIVAACEEFGDRLHGAAVLG
jgi:hypothetical protein